MDTLSAMSERDLRMLRDRIESEKRGSRFDRARRLTAVRRELDRRSQLRREDLQRYDLTLYLITAGDVDLAELARRFERARQLTPLFARAIMMARALRDLRAFEFRRRHRDEPVTAELLERFERALNRPMPFRYGFTIGERDLVTPGGSGRV